MVFQVEILDICDDPIALTVQQGYQYEENYIHGQQQAFRWHESGVFSVDPPVCEITYSCSMINGPRMDLCDIQDDQTTGFFDP